MKKQFIQLSHEVINSLVTDMNTINVSVICVTRGDKYMEPTKQLFMCCVEGEPVFVNNVLKKYKSEHDYKIK